MAVGPDPTNPRRSQVTVYVPRKLADDLHHIAGSLGISQSELLRRLAEDFVAGVPTSTPNGATAA